MTGINTRVPIERHNGARSKYLAGLQWHFGAFVIINAFFWLMDLALGQSGLQWAYWITVPWAFALAFHVLAWWVDGSKRS